LTEYLPEIFLGEQTCTAGPDKTAIPDRMFRLKAF
jgi:hypothetical protein